MDPADVSELEFSISRGMFLDYLESVKKIAPAAAAMTRGMHNLVKKNILQQCASCYIEKATSVMRSPTAADDSTGLFYLRSHLEKMTKRYFAAVNMGKPSGWNTDHRNHSR